MPQVNVSVEHRLDRQEAKRRLGTLIEKVRELGGVWSQRWNSDSCLSFEGKWNGQNIAGELSVQDRSVDAKVTVPWTLVVFTGRIKKSLEESARQVLADS